MLVLDEERRGAISRVTAAEGEEAAAALFGFAQEHLRWFRSNGYRVRDEKALVELWRVQAIAFEVAAAKCLGGRRRAKELQIDAARGEPLTVCVGDLAPKQLPARLPPSMAAGLPPSVRTLADLLDPAGELEPHKIPTIDWNIHGSGCLAICAESLGLRRPSIRRWCVDCAKLTSARVEARINAIAKNFEAPSVAVVANGRRTREWVRTCGCGKLFKTARPNRLRCDRCRAHHRSSRNAM
jgi:hypothetical protein